MPYSRTGKYTAHPSPRSPGEHIEISSILVPAGRRYSFEGTLPTLTRIKLLKVRRYEQDIGNLNFVLDELAHFRMIIASSKEEFLYGCNSQSCSVTAP
jgi:hypothetical protein